MTSSVIKKDMFGNLGKQIGDLVKRTGNAFVRADQMNSGQELLEHMVRTYFRVRIGMVVISAVFAPFLLFIGQYWYNIEPQDSMSAYYFAGPPSESPIRGWLNAINIQPINLLLSALAQLDNEAPMRSWFVGFLFVLGILLYLYRGFSDLENVALSLAGLSAVMVAIFPMPWDCDNSCNFIPVHYAFAVVTLGCMAYVVIFCSKKCFKFLPDERWQKFYSGLYTLNGYLMIGLIVLVAFQFLIPGLKLLSTFSVEMLCIMLFAAYWLVKSIELQHSQADRKALKEVLDSKLNQG